MSSLLTARDMNDDDGSKDRSFWTVIGKGNKKLVFRPAKSLALPLVGSHN